MKVEPFEYLEVENRLNSALNEAARLDTSPYETINDDSPKGRGTWTFSIDSYPSHPNDYAKLERDKKLIDITDTYETAVKTVKSRFPNAKTIYLLP